MHSLDQNRILLRRVFYGADLELPFPACWDVYVSGTCINAPEQILARYLMQARPEREAGEGNGYRCRKQI